MIKRLFDLTSSFLGLLFLSPLLLVLAILVKLSSRGPILYRQLRVGRDGLDFYLLKFRSMRPNSDAKGLLTVGSRDSRVTRVGYFLRKYKLDELPQLLNVLMGDMSIVGPRPEVRKYVNYYTTEQFKVLSVKPGITDLASIHFRNESDLLAASNDPEGHYIKEIMPEKLSLNLQYIRNNNVFIDVKLIFQTVMKIITS